MTSNKDVCHCFTAIDMSKQIDYYIQKGCCGVRFSLKLEVENEFLNGIYRDLANLVGEEKARLIYEEYRGQQIIFPVEFYNKQYIYNQIITEYDGTNLMQLATKYCYSERTIRRILKEQKKG